MGLRKLCLGVLIVLLCLNLGHAAIRMDTSGESLSRTTGVPAFGDLTRMFWIYRVVDSATDEILSYISVDSALASNYLGCYTAGSTQELVHEANGLGNNTNGTHTSPFALATWYHITQVFDNTANTLNSYINGVAIGTGALTGLTGTLTWGFETFNFTGALTNGRFFGFKEWTAVLNTTEMATEMKYITPVRRANLHSYSPFRTITELNSYVGGATWTANGTLTTEADPPIQVSPGNGFLSF